LPHYRFQVMAQKATELCGEVRSLGAELLYFENAMPALHYCDHGMKLNC
jgi:hypothetical protein